MFVATNQAYFMGFFFLLAGYFTPASLERKGYARFIGDRFLRLGLPLLAFGFVLGPLTDAMVTAAQGGGFWSTFVWLWNHKVFGNGPLWFVQALLMFSLAYCLWRAFFGTPLAGAQRTVKPVPAYRWWLICALGVGSAAFAIRQFVPTGENVIGLQLGYFASYIFLYGGGNRRMASRLDSPVDLETCPALDRHACFRMALHAGGAAHRTRAVWPAKRISLAVFPGPRSSMPSGSPSLPGDSSPDGCSSPEHG